MHRVLTGFLAAIVVFIVNTQAQALVFPLSPGDSILVSGNFLCTKTLPCEGGDLYAFSVDAPAAFEANLALNNYSDVSMELFPAASPGTPLQSWAASSPGTTTPISLAYAGLLPGIVYNFSIFGSVPNLPGLIQVGGFDGSIGIKAAPVSTAPVSAVPLPGAFWLFGSGLLTLLLGFARRR